jgi:hypothetical protein
LIVIGIASILVILFLIVFILKKRGVIEDSEPDYRTFFIIGLAFFPIGIATRNPGLWGMGLVFFILGITNRDKWKLKDETN